MDPDVDSGIEAPQNRQNNVHHIPRPPPNEQAHNDLNHGVLRPRGVVAVIFQVCQHILIVFLAFIVLLNAAPKNFPEASCKLPVLSAYFPHCAQELDHPRNPSFHPDFITLSRLQSRLEYVMEDSAVSPAVADNLKNSEVALRDLVKRVKISSLVRKDALGQDLEHFVADAKKTGASLQEFSSHVWGAVDRIVGLNEHVLITLEGMLPEAPWRTFCGVANFLIPTWRETAAVHQRIVEDLWLRAAESLDDNLQKLIHEAQANLGFLQRLERRLNNIQDTIVVEEEKLRDDEQAFKRQWFPDQTEWRSNSNNLEVLDIVKNYRNGALKHVTNVLVELKRMSYDLRDLRGAIVEPVFASSSNIPIEAYTRSIRNATERLLHGQTRAREIESDYRRKKFCSDYST